MAAGLLDARKADPVFAGVVLDGCDVAGHHGGSQCLPSGPQGSGTSSQSFFRAKWHESANGGGALPEVRSGAWRQIDDRCVQRAYSTTSPGMTRIQRHSLRRRGASLINCGPAASSAAGGEQGEAVTHGVSGFQRRAASPPASNSSNVQGHSLGRATDGGHSSAMWLAVSSSAL